MASKGEAGFTLLEVLVAITVFGFLLLGLGSGLDFGMRAWLRQDRGIAARGELDAVDRTLRNLVARLDPAGAVTGTAHGLAFTSTLPQAAAGQADMALGVDGERRLVLRWTPHVHALRLSPAPPPETAELLRDVQRLDLAYWPRDGNGWTAAWEADVPPALLRIRIVFPPNDPRRWADIVVGPARTPAGRR